MDFRFLVMEKSWKINVEEDGAPWQSQKFVFGRTVGCPVEPGEICRSIDRCNANLRLTDQFTVLWYCWIIVHLQETRLSLTNRTTHLEVNQGHQTCYHSMC